MEHRSSSSAKLIWGLLAAIIVVVLGFLALQRDDTPAPPPEPVPQAAPEVAKIEPPTVPATLPRLNRQALLLAANMAADATAAGRPLPLANGDLIGRSFDLRLPFGCSGPVGDQVEPADRPWAGWTFNPKTRALQLRATPEQWGEVDWVKQVAGTLPFEAVEGFWIERPWTNVEACPPAATSPVPVRQGSAPQTLGIAQFFAPDEPRTRRRGSRPYAATVKQEADIPAAPRPFNLLISGRIIGFADGQSIRCSDNGARLRPTCLFAVQYTKVAFEDPSDGKILAEWEN